MLCIRTSHLPPQGGGWRRRCVHNVKDPTLPRVFLRWHRPSAPPGRELEMKVPGAAVASAAFAGVVVFITQIYSEPRRSRPEPRHSTGGRDGSYKPRFGSIEFHVLMADKIASELREPNRLAASLY
jgi:hypothetical protein